MIAEPVVHPHEYRPGQPSSESIFHTVVRDKDGRIKHDSYHHNSRTNVGGDWQSRLMAGVGATAQAAVGLTGTASAATGTSLTISTTTANIWIGFMVIVGGVYGIITANTTTVLTVDMWQSPASPGTAGTTPTGTPIFAIVPAGPTYYMALTSDATGIPGPPNTDTALASELTTNGLGRVAGTTAHTTTTTTTPSFTVSHPFSCSGGSGTTINKEAIFNAASSGVMTFESAEPSPPLLNSGDSLTQTVTVSY